MKARLEEPNERELIEWVQGKVPAHLRNQLFGEEARKSERWSLLKVTGVHGFPQHILDESLRQLLNKNRFHTTIDTKACKEGFYINSGDNRAEDMFLR